MGYAEHVDAFPAVGVKIQPKADVAPGSRTVASRGILDYDEDDLGPDGRVRFELTNGVVLEVCRAGQQGPTGSLEVRAVNGHIVVLPGAANRVFIRGRSLS